MIPFPSRAVMAQVDRGCTNVFVTCGLSRRGLSITMALPGGMFDDVAAQGPPTEPPGPFETVPGLPGGLGNSPRGAGPLLNKHCYRYLIDSLNIFI